METESEKSEGTQEQKATNEQPEWMKGQIGQIISMLNQPGIASALASVGLYFAIDPKAIKTSLDEVKESNARIVDAINELIEENIKIKKQLKKLTSRSEDEESHDSEMNGYRKAGNRTNNTYLD
jgi:DNA polymerase III delta prime subunit